MEAVTKTAHSISEDSDQNVQMYMLIWDFVVTYVLFYVLLCIGSNQKCVAWVKSKNLSMKSQKI